MLTPQPPNHRTLAIVITLRGGCVRSDFSREAGSVGRPLAGKSPAALDLAMLA